VGRCSRRGRLGGARPPLGGMLTGMRLEDNGSYAILDTDTFGSSRRALDKRGGPPPHLEEPAAANSPLLPKDAQGHFDLGVTLKANGDLNGAIACYRKAIDLDAKFARAHLSLGSALQSKGDLDEAIRSYRKASAWRPGTPWPITRSEGPSRPREICTGPSAAIAKRLTSTPSLSGPTSPWVSLCKALAISTQPPSAIARPSASSQERRGPLQPG